MWGSWTRSRWSRHAHQLSISPYGQRSGACIGGLRFLSTGKQTAHSASEQQGAVQAVHTIHSNDRPPLRSGRHRAPSPDRRPGTLRPFRGRKAVTQPGTRNARPGAQGRRLAGHRTKQRAFSETTEFSCAEKPGRRGSTAMAARVSQRRIDDLDRWDGARGERGCVRCEWSRAKMCHWHVSRRILVLRHSGYDFLVGWSRVAAGLG